MTRSTNAVAATSLKFFGYGVIALMAVAIVYAGVTAILNWTEIAV